jgi:hypothetical protein
MARGAGPRRGAACAGHRSGHGGGRRALRGVRAPPALHGDVEFHVRAARDAHGGALRRVVIPPRRTLEVQCRRVAVGDPSGIPPRCRSSPSPRRPAIRRASSPARRSGAAPGGAASAAPDAPPPPIRAAGTAPDAPGPTEPRHPDGGSRVAPESRLLGRRRRFRRAGRRRARPFPPRSPAACGDGGASPRAGSLRRRVRRRRAVGALMRAAPHGRRSSPMSPPPPRAMLRAYE